MPSGSCWLADRMTSIVPALLQLVDFIAALYCCCTVFTCEAAIPLISGARFISQSNYDFQCSFSGLQHSTCCRQGRTWHVSYCCIFASQPNHRCSIMHSFHCSSLVPVNHSWHPSMNAIKNPLNFNRGFCSGLLRYTNCSHLSATPGAALLPDLLFSALRLLLSGIPTRLLASCLCLTYQRLNCSHPST